MLSFESDYTQGAHLSILERLIETNFDRQTGYGVDDFCISARKKIRAACECPDAEVHFLVGGTQTNAVVISSLLHDYEGVISAVTGHVAAHESGAIEYTGHKVITLPAHDGKLDADEVRDLLKTFYSDANYEHMVFPGMVYISHPTEYGTLYSKEELTALSTVCREYHIPLYMDGARLGYALASYATDLSLADIARLCDVFYIGGTKVGALCGEAVVYTHPNAPAHMLTIIKQHGALLAKGRLLGIQFDTLFTDGLYQKISRNAIDMAEMLKTVLRDKGYVFFKETDTNQQFILLENSKMAALEKQVKFSFWERADDDHTVVRFATSWATTPEEIEALAAIL